MLSGLQIKMARIALSLDAADLAESSGVGTATISRIENGGGAHASTLAKLQAALEAGGAVFIADRQPSPDGGPGVRLGVGGAGVALAAKPSGKAGKRSASKAKAAAKGRKRIR